MCDGRTASAYSFPRELGQSIHLVEPCLSESFGNIWNVVGGPRDHPVVKT